MSSSDDESDHPVSAAEEAFQERQQAVVKRLNAVGCAVIRGVDEDVEPPYSEEDIAAMRVAPRVPASRPLPLARARRPTRGRMGDCLAASASGPAPASGEGGMTLLTFDVDGTLIRAVGESANKLHKDAFAHAMRVVFDLDTNIDVIKHHGSTDQLVLADVLRHHGVDETRVWEAMPRMMEEMVAYFESHEEDASLGLELLPGVERLLEALSKREDVIVCLVTGNLEPVARGKMKKLGVWRYFTPPPASTRAEIPFLGGFGSDHTQRDELVRLARDRVLRAFDLKDAVPLEGFEGFETKKNARFLRDRVHFGDTPNDVKAAAASGAMAFAVTTGVFSKRELEAHFMGLEPERCVVFDGLEDTQAVLEACGLK